MNRWYVVHAKPNSEVRAALNLDRQGFEAYLPLYLGQRRHARRTERVAKPLFPRYLFVRLDLDRDPWRAVNGTFGVSHLVAVNGMPAPVPDSVVEVTRQRENNEGYVRLGFTPFRSGERLEILEGPMTAHKGLFQHMQDSDRIVLLLNLLGRPVRVTVPRMAVTAA